MWSRTRRPVRPAGCIREFLGDYDQERVKFMVTQKVGMNTKKEWNCCEPCQNIQDSAEDIPMNCA